MGASAAVVVSIVIAVAAIVAAVAQAGKARRAAQVAEARLSEQGERARAEAAEARRLLEEARLAATSAPSGPGPSLAQATGEAERLVEEARRRARALEKEAAIAAKEEALRLRQEQEAALAGDRKELQEWERRLRQREESIEKRAEQAERRDADLDRRLERLAEREARLKEGEDRIPKLEAEARRALEERAGLTAEEARRQVIEAAEVDARKDVAQRIRKVEDEVQERAEKTAKNIISTAIQRYAGDYACEKTVTVVPLPNDEVKGRIIGREGRNIRALEAATGIDLIIDDTPEAVILSGYNPVRREVARMALEALIADGRIHPGRVEETVKKAEAEFGKRLKEAGEQACYEAGVHGVHPEIVKLLGALKWRTSYGQNQWQHALEASFLCGMMAGELGLNVKKAKRAGLLHDIGKVIDQTAEGSHALIGAEFAKRHGESPLVVNAIASHHEEVPQETIYAALTQAADAISGARPGARREMVDTYLKRLDDLERISNSFPGVERSFAVQAGREVRILVENGQIGDHEAVVLSRDIARRIEEEMSYPGQIKVTVIRETRAIEYAR
ncbi:ribonuclease Y [Myxococcota bacterium]|nr:ribonuclease Y [Myxococcota bacterium]